MRIRRVRIPLNFVYVSSMYVMDSTVRTIVELESENGEVGIGDGPGYPEVVRLTAALARTWLGRDLRDRDALRREFAPTTFHNRNGRNGWSALATLETSAWDLVARHDGVSLSQALGGALRRSIEVVCPLSAAVFESASDATDLRAHMADRANAYRVAECARAHAEERGFRCFKYKSAALDPGWDLCVMRELRAALGPQSRLRFDPNAGYSVAEALGLCGDLDELELEFLEDPAPELEGLSTVRSASASSVATNMFVTSREHLAPAARLQAVDVVLADVFLWGGIQGFHETVRAVDGRGMEVAIHSLFESGVGTAVNLHLAAACEPIRRANDSGLHLLEHSLCLNPPIVEGGHMLVPKGPGNGVELDQEAVGDMTIEEIWVT